MEKGSEGGEREGEVKEEEGRRGRGEGGKERERREVELNASERTDDIIKSS